MRSSSENRFESQKKYSDKSFIARYSNRKFFGTITLLLDKIRFESVLDAGCGEGVSLNYVSRKYPFTKVFTGFDLDRRRARLAHQDDQALNFFVSNIQSIPFESDSFDLLICLETLEHVGDPVSALAEIARVTKQYALISVPNEPWWRIGNMVRGKYLQNFGNTPGHINHWTTKQFHALIRQNLIIVDIASPVLWNFVLAKK